MGQVMEMYNFYLLAGTCFLVSSTSLKSLACRNNCLRISEDVCGTTPCLNGCNPGWHGSHCSKRCSIECRNSKCHQDNGYCIEGKYLMSISGLKKRQGGTMKISKRSPRNCLVSDDVHANKCKCCDSKYRGDNCKTFCQNCETFETEDDCKYLCKPGHHGKTCENTCPDTCKVGSYGRPVCKSDYGVIDCSYGCTAGYYGDSCDRMCSGSCLNKTCHQVDGSCLNCPDGYYGNDCTYPCNKKCVDERCFRNGTCIYGCKNDRFCNNTCPVNCQETNSTKSSCDENNLVCLYGCKHGFFGDQCDKLCVTLCIECEKDTGDCLRCKEPWLGGKCDQKCVDNCEEGCYHNGTCRKCSPGYYGDSCIKDRKVNRNSKSTQGTAPVQIIVPCSIGLAVIVFVILYLVLRLKFKKARCLDRFLCGRCLKEGENARMQNHHDEEEIELPDAENRQQQPLLCAELGEQLRPQTTGIKDNPFMKADDELRKKKLAYYRDRKENEPPDAEVPVHKGPNPHDYVDGKEIHKKEVLEAKGQKPVDFVEENEFHLPNADVPEKESQNHDDEEKERQLPDAEVHEEEGSADEIEIQPTGTEVPVKEDPHSSGSADEIEIQPTGTGVHEEEDPHPSVSADGMEIQPTDTDYKIGDNPFKKADDEKKRLARGKNKN